ncbi:putative lyase [Aquisphaera giovannonii]|uniref:Putative lyase n=1 Tax=Aquisphaera giovannonii TaxID=406548 RepID=A0A5B9W8R8_9BACT|nr:HEAT repeat domain-containing protein [Aquisphaera giovannonii]QEH37032.1 putative lyase [Aquisphaera giovannonii]
MSSPATWLPLAMGVAFLLSPPEARAEGPLATPTNRIIRDLKDGHLDAKVAALQQISRLGSRAVPLLADLIAALGDPEPRVRAAAARILGGLGREAMPAGTALIAGLSDPVLEVRVAAAKSLLRVPADPEQLVPAVLAAIRERPEGLSDLAVEILSRSGPRAVPAAIDLLGDRGTGRVRLGAKVILQLGREAASASTALLEACRGAGRELRLEIAQALEATSPSSLPLIIAALRDRDPKVRGTAARAVAFMSFRGAPAMPALLDALIDPGTCDDPALPDHRMSVNNFEDPEIGFGYHAALVSIGPEAQKALISRLDSPRPGERAAAVRAIGAFGQAAGPAVPKLVGFLARPGLRAQAAEALGRIGYPAHGTVPMLVTSLKMKDPELRFRAAQALGQMGLANTPAAKEAIRGLNAAAKDPEPRIRLAAASSLAQISQSQFAEMIPLLRDPDAKVRRFALMMIANREKHDDSVIADILESMRDHDPRIRRAAAVAVNRDDMGRDRVVAALLDMLRDPDPEARTEAAINLATVDAGQSIWISPDRNYQGQAPSHALAAAPGAGKRLRAALEDPDRRVRVAAAHALTALKREAGENVPALLLRLRTDPSGLVRAAAASALGRYGDAAAPALPALLAALGDPTEDGQNGRLMAYAVAGAIRVIRGDDPGVINERLVGLLEDPRPRVREIASYALLSQTPQPLLELCTRLKDPRTTREYRYTIIRHLAWHHGTFAPAARFPAQKRQDVEGPRRALEAALPVLEAVALDIEADDQLRHNAYQVAASVHPAPEARIRLLLEVFGRSRLGIPEPAILGNTPPAAVGTLIAGLDDPDRAVRTVAAYTAWAPVSSQPPDDDPAAPRNRVIAALTRALDDAEPQVRWAAATALGDLGQSRNPQQPRRIARETIRRLGVMVRDRSARLQPGDWFRSSDAGVPTGAVPTVGNQPGPKLRAVAARALGCLASGGDESVRDLIQALDDEDNLVRWYAVRALGQLGPEGRAAVGPLVAVLGGHKVDTPSRFVADPRYFAAWSLGQIGKDAGSALPALIRALSDPDPSIRNVAAMSIAAVAPGDPAALRELTRAMHDRYDSDLANSARAGLLAMRSQSVPVFLADLDSADLNDRLAAVNCLGALGPTSKAALPRLKKLAEKADFDLKQMATNAIERIESRSLQPAQPEEEDALPADPHG